jgi:hypothetical protein
MPPKNLIDQLRRWPGVKLSVVYNYGPGLCAPAASCRTSRAGFKIIYTRDSVLRNVLSCEMLGNLLINIAQDPLVPR